MLGQDDNERIMGERLRQWGLAVQWNTELVSFEQSADPRHGDAQTAATARPARSRRVHGGCDGGRSTVRELSASGFRAPYEHVFFVADTKRTHDGAGRMNVYLLRDGFHLFFPMRGRIGCA